MRCFREESLPVRKCVWGATIWALLGLAATPGVGLTIQSVSQSASQVGLYQPLTIRFGLSRAYANPYDPALVDAQFEFTGPSGQARTIPAFYAAENPAWMARIVPLETGAHTCRILVSDHTGESAQHALAFSAVPSNARGFLRIDPRSSRHLRFDNGEPYRPVGQNLCWGGNQSLFYTWLDRMAAAGQNWTRYWMVPYVGQGIEWGPNTAGTLGVYSQSQSRMFDSMISGARDRGIMVQLCMDSFNGWNFHLYDNWQENPYNTTNGGMCPHPVDYFSNAQARQYAQRLFRYIVARWAYDTSILCWEFFNEIDALGSGSNRTFWGNEQLVANWHREMARYIRSIDPFGHLITTSFADDGPRASYALFWNMPEMEIVQVHRYSSLLPDAHIQRLRLRWPFGKPIIMGEANLAGDPGSLEKEGNSLHTLAWAAAVEQSGAMPWWWDSWIHPNNLYGRFTPVAAYLAGEDWGPQSLDQLAATRIAGPSDLQLYGSSGPRHAYLFIRGLAAPVGGVRVRLDSIQAGNYHVEFWNTLTGVPLDTSLRALGNAPTLDVPTFNWDIALKVKMAGPSLAVEPVYLEARCVAGEDAPAGEFGVTNSGSEISHYTITTSANWLSVSPEAGSSTGETDAIAVNYATSQLSVGAYQASIIVSDPASANSPQTIVVDLVVAPRPADLDGDLDVDMEDYGRFQACLSGQGQTQSYPECLAARLDNDADVDGDDVRLFVDCLSGANVRSDAACAE
ncbi:MAG: hypothetical protein AMXMBFR13_09570 [Phycisphaerae bacterium]